MKPAKLKNVVYGVRAKRVVRELAKVGEARKPYERRVFYARRSPAFIGAPRGKLAVVRVVKPRPFCYNGVVVAVSFLVERPVCRKVRRALRGVRLGAGCLLKRPFRKVRRVCPKRRTLVRVS